MQLSPPLSQRLGYSQQVLRRVSLSLVLALAIVADRGCGDAAVLKPPRVVSSADKFDRNEGSWGHVGCPHNFRLFTFTPSSFNRKFIQPPSSTSFLFFSKSPFPLSTDARMS